jgi:sterol 3beta-glucosyltransferase
MKLLIASYGTEGDVRPLAVLARRWMKAGHEAMLLADRATLDVALQCGVPCDSLSGDIRAGTAPGVGIAGVVGPKRGPQELTRALAAIANRQSESWLRTILELGTEADAIVGSGLAVFSALSAGERLGLPVVGASFIPLTPTRAFASPFLPPARWPGLVNLASHQLLNALIWRSVRGACNAARQKVAGLPPRQRPWTTHPVLYGISPTLLSRPADWPSQVHLTGQLIDPATDWAPPLALAAFLGAGPPPIYVGFGSMVGFDRAAVWHEVRASLRGRRALIAPGWGGVAGIDLPENMLVIDEAPHEALFAHVSTVVHHGGSGTSHTAARSGRPSVVVAFAGDQAFWGSRLAALGIAAPPLQGHRLTAAALTRAIEAAERDDVKARAGELGACMRAEDGAGHAVALLERHLGLRQPRAT